MDLEDHLSKRSHTYRIAQTGSGWGWPRYSSNCTKGNGQRWSCHLLVTGTGERGDLEEEKVVGHSSSGSQIGRHHHTSLDGSPSTPASRRLTPFPVCQPSIPTYSPRLISFLTDRPATMAFFCHHAAWSMSHGWSPPCIRYVQQEIRVYIGFYVCLTERNGIYELNREL